MGRGPSLPLEVDRKGFRKRFRKEALFPTGRISALPQSFRVLPPEAFRQSCRKHDPFVPASLAAMARASDTYTSAQAAQILGVGKGSDVNIILGATSAAGNGN